MCCQTMPDKAGTGGGRFCTGDGILVGVQSGML